MSQNGNSLAPGRIYLEEAVDMLMERLGMPEPVAEAKLLRLLRDGDVPAWRSMGGYFGESSMLARDWDDARIEFAGSRGPGGPRSNVTFPHRSFWNRTSLGHHGRNFQVSGPAVEYWLECNKPTAVTARDAPKSPPEYTEGLACRICNWMINYQTQFVERHGRPARRDTIKDKNGTIVEVGVVNACHDALGCGQRNAVRAYTELLLDRFKR